MKKYFLLFLLSFSIFILHTIYTHHAIYGDGNGYYSYTNALFFEHKLNFDPVYGFLSNFRGRNYIFSRVFWDTSYAQNGLIRQNPYLIGTGITWLPSMIFISAINYVFNLGASMSSLVYELGPGITGILLIIFGLFFLEKYLLNFFSKRTVFWVILTTFFASNVFYYTTFEPALSHQPSFFLISFLLYWTYRFKPTKTNIFLLGALCGLLVIVRIADTILLIPVLYQIKPKGLYILPFFAGFTIAVSPQFCLQKLMYGSVFSNPYLTGQSGTWQLDFFHTLEYLFFPKRGLFFWSPIFLVSLWGLIKSKSKTVLVSILLLWLVTSSWSAYLSAGFGQRFSFSAAPYFALGLAYLFERLDDKNIFLYSIPFTLWNFILLIGFYVLKLGR